MLRHLTAACLAALLALSRLPRVAAKPPDLPDDEPIIVSIARADRDAEGGGRLPLPAARPTARALTECDPKTMPSVLDNLRKLEKAAAEIDLARKLGAAGKVMEAIEPPRRGPQALPRLVLRPACRGGDGRNRPRRHPGRRVRGAGTALLPRRAAARR